MAGQREATLGEATDALRAATKPEPEVLGNSGDSQSEKDLIYALGTTLIDIARSLQEIAQTLEETLIVHGDLPRWPLPHNKDE